MTKTQVRAKELYTEFVNTLDPKVSYSMPEFNLALKQFLAERVAASDTLLYDAIWDCKDENQLEGTEDGKMPEGTYPEGW